MLGPRMGQILEQFREPWYGLMRLLGHFHGLEILPVTILDVLLDPEAAFQGLVLCIVSTPLSSTPMYVDSEQTHMGYHHNTIPGQCEI